MEFFGVEALVFTIFFRGIPIFLTGRPIFFRGRTHIPHGQTHILQGYTHIPHGQTYILSGVGPIFFKGEPVLKEVFRAECNVIQSLKIKRGKQKSQVLNREGYGYQMQQPIETSHENYGFSSLPRRRSQVFVTLSCPLMSAEPKDKFLSHVRKQWGRNS